MTEVDILLVGSGSLARAVVMAAASAPRPAASILLVARNEMVVRQIVMLARARAAALANPLSIDAAVSDYTWESLDRLFAGVRPKIVVQLASLQSPWHMAPKWRRMIASAGYGITLPLQAVLADRVLRVARARHADCLLVNGCYPDAVNHVLTTRGVMVDAGIGNIAILSALLRSLQLGEPRMVAHHAHVAAQISGQPNGLPPPALWLDARRVEPEDCAALLGPFHLPADDALNVVTAAAAVAMFRSLAGVAERWVGHAPGVHGRLGGYPVVVEAGHVRLDLPVDLSEAAALAHNERYQRWDGLATEDGWYRSVKGDADIWRECGIRVPPELLSWRAADLEEQARRLSAFRATLESGAEPSLGV